MRKKFLALTVILTMILSAIAIPVISNAGADNKKLVALTFDDGPNDTYYKNALDLLWDYDIRATFFLISDNVIKYPQMTDRTVNEGHEVGLHGAKNFTDFTIEQVNAELDKCQSAIYNAAKTYAKLLRLPGLIVPKSYTVQRQIQYPLISAKFTSPEAAVSGSVSDGDIILIHQDWDGKNNFESTKALIEKLNNENFEFVTVSELFERKGVTPVNALHQYTSVSAPAATSSSSTTAPVTGAMGENGMLINFDDRNFEGYQRQQDYTTSSPAKYTSYSVVEETYTNSDGEAELCSASGKAFKIAFPSGQTSRNRFASITLSNLAVSGISSEAKGIKFWAKSIGGNTTLEKVGIAQSPKANPQNCVQNLVINGEGKYYYLPYSTLGVLSGDDLSAYKYFSIYADLYGKDNKTIYIDNISLYDLGQGETTTAHFSETYPTSSRATVRPVKNIKYTSIESGINFSDTNGTITSSSNVYGLSEKIPAKSGDKFKFSAIKTSQWPEGITAFAAAYDANDKFLGIFVHNYAPRGDQYAKYVGRCKVEKLSNVNAYSCGLGYDKKYYTDVEIQIPDSTDDKALFSGISYIRVKAFKDESAGITEDKFYVEYIGNSKPEAEILRHLPEDRESGLSDKLGDLNADGDVDIKDLLYLRKYLAGFQGYVADIGNSDFNFDGKINLKDFAYLRRNFAVEGYDGYELKDNQKMIALSFDDSPDKMADSLSAIAQYKSENVRATYMLSAARMYNTTTVLQRAKALGCDFGNHSSFHFDMRGWASNEIYKEMNWTQDLIFQQTGMTNKYFRPPFFLSNKHLSDTLSDMVFILGTSSSDTSNNVTAEQSAQSQLEQAKDGNIILLHDNNKLKATLEILIPKLLENGYKIVTVDELFKYKHISPQSGYTYTNVYEPQAIN